MSNVFKHPAAGFPPPDAANPNPDALFIFPGQQGGWTLERVRPFHGPSTVIDCATKAECLALASMIALRDMATLELVHDERAIGSEFNDIAGVS